MVIKHKNHDFIDKALKDQKERYMTYEELKELHNLLIDAKIDMKKRAYASARMKVVIAMRSGAVELQLNTAKQCLISGNIRGANHAISKAMLIINVDKKRLRNAKINREYKEALGQK